MTKQTEGAKATGSRGFKATAVGKGSRHFRMTALLPEKIRAVVANPFSDPIPMAAYPKYVGFRKIFQKK